MDKIKYTKDLDLELLYEVLVGEYKTEWQLSLSPHDVFTRAFRDDKIEHEVWKQAHNYFIDRWWK